MSLSNLGAQLASLHGGKKDGSIVPSSRRREDSIGRGLHYSARRGHVITHSAHSAHRASVLFESSKEASDVSVQDLREACAAAMEKLELLQGDGANGFASLVNEASLRFERNLATKQENQEVDEKIARLLRRLTVLLYHVYDDCLYVLEYLLRRYEIHSRIGTAEELLLIAIPHHETPLFARVLQLLDLTSVGGRQTFVFLRPFSVTATSASPVPRSVLSKRASQDDVLLAMVASLAQNTQEAFASASADEQSSAARVFSFAATVVIEALDLQWTSAGTIREATLRCLLPKILHACQSSSQRPHHRDYRAFGHVLACHLANRCTLAQQTREVFANAILRNLQQGDDGDDDDNGDDAPTLETVERASDTLLSLLSVSRKKSTAGGAPDDSANFLKFPTEIRRKRMPHDADDAVLRSCPLAESTFLTLTTKIRPKLLAMALQHLQTTTQVDVLPLVSSLVAMSLRFSSQTQEAPENLVMHLWGQPAIFASPRLTEATVARLLEAAVEANGAAESDDDGAALRKKVIKACRTILSALSDANSRGHDVGVAIAVHRMKKLLQKKKKQRRFLEKLLQNSDKDLDAFMETDLEDEMNEEVADKDTADEEDDEAMVEKLLPPMVAIEHPNSSLRLGAIQQLVDAQKQQATSNEEEQMEVDTQDLRSLCDALLRRVASDDVGRVVVAAASGLSQLQAGSIFANSSFAEGVLKAVYRWISDRSFSSVDIDNLRKKKPSGNPDSSDRDGRLISPETLSSLSSALELGGLAARALIEKNIASSDRMDIDDDEEEDAIESSTTLLCNLFEAMASLLDLENTSSDAFGEVILSASKSICYALQGAEQPKEPQDPGTQAMMLLWTHEWGQSTIRRSCAEPMPSDWGGDAAVIHRTRIQFLFWCVSSYPKMKELRQKPQATSALDNTKQFNASWKFPLCASHHILGLSTSSVVMGKVVTKRSPELINCMAVCADELCARSVDHVPDALTRMASVNAKSAIQHQIVVPFIEKVLENVTSTKLLRKKKKGGSLAFGRSPVTILMEVASRPDMPLDGLKLCLELGAKTFETEKKYVSQLLRHAVIPLLALMRHTDGGVREAALKIAASTAARTQSDPTTTVLSEFLSFASNSSFGNSSSLLMDGASSFTTFLADATANSPNIAGLRNELLDRCSDSASILRGSSSLGGDLPIEGEWLPPGTASGYATAVATVLDAMALVGEQSFPLATKWKTVGKSILSTIISLDTVPSSGLKSVPMSPAVQRLAASTLTMLKGVTADRTQAANEIIISIGPDGAGGRARSYSIGNAEGLSLLNPYPDDMVDTISELLPSTDRNSIRASVRNAVIDLVVSRPSWAGARGIFPKLSQSRRIEIATKLIAVRSRLGDEAAGRALMGLHLTCEDLSTMLERAIAEDTMDGMLEVIFICDCIRSRANELSREKEVLHLVYSLFGCVPKTGNVASKEVFHNEHAQVGTLQAIRALLIQTEANGDSRNSSKGRTWSFGAQSSQLVALLGAHPSGGSRESGYSLRTEVIFDSLRCLCLLDSSSVESLLPALEQVIRRKGTSSETDKTEENEDHLHSAGVRHAVLAVVPTYCNSAGGTGLSFGGLLLTLIGALRDEGVSERTHEVAKNAIVEALVLIPNRNGDESAVASTIAAFAAEEARLTATSKRKLMGWEEYSVEGAKEPRWLTVSMGMLYRTDPREQLVACLFLTRITLALAKLSESELEAEMSSSTRSDKGTRSDYKADAKFLLDVLSAETSQEEMSTEDQNVVEGVNWTVALLSSVVRSWLTGKGAKKIIRKCDDESHSSLEFWQELMHLLSVLIQKKAENQFFSIELAHAATRDGLDLLQWSLPEPEFLAALSGLLQERHLAETIHVRALQALSDRAAATNPFSPQARLFVEVIPDLVSVVSDLVGKTVDGDDSGSVLVAQKALMTISGLTRTLCSATDSKEWTTETSPSLRSTLDQILAVLSKTQAKMEPAFKQRKTSLFLQSECQLLNSAAQCAAALVSALKTQSIQYLPKLVPLLTATMAAINCMLGHWTESDDHPHYQAAKQSQLCLLRGLGAVVEELPQFLGQYLGSIFGADCLVSISLRKTGNDADLMVSEASERLDNVLATRTPARHLVPCACSAIISRIEQEQEGLWTEICVLLQIIMTCIKTWPRADLSSGMSKVFTTLLAVYDGQLPQDSRDELLEASNEVFLSMVMKISETQLRRLYSRLKEWKGDDLSSWTRRHAFWTLSATLSSHLRSIFLPCFTSAVTDAVAELELSVSVLCSPASSKGSTEGKKRRVDESPAASPNCLRPLLPLLRCLETCLRADAHDGGGWIRGDDAQRYRILLAPIGRLLQAKVSVSSSAALGLTSGSYLRVVHGCETEGPNAGSVVSCLTALATAAGNEQLWKPLNLALVESCGHRGRSEVRKAGVKCLSQILRSVGEEYMVLLPECLPVLSELLEDDDEEISTLARECIRQGEELLGESLEENLV